MSARPKAARSMARHDDLPRRDPLLVPKRSILVVDRCEETREVLRTALTRGDTEVLLADRAEQGLEMARRCHPDVIVLDAEIESAGWDEISAGFNHESRHFDTQLVLLGSARRVRQTFPNTEVVAKPYHYAPLIRKIEELLSRHQQPLFRSA